MAIKTQSGQIPQNAGVYFFRGKHGKILYIGKAANLKARLTSYFAKNAAPKTASMLEEAKTVNWEVVNSEVEALIKEAELIKRYRPKYNVLMRDDKNYFYAGFTKEKYPKIFVTHQPSASRKPYAISHKAYGVRRTAGFIGPFTEGGTLRSVLKTLRRAFPYCTCKSPHKQLCLNAKLKKCLGFCCLTHSLPRSKFLALNPACAGRPLFEGSDASPNLERGRLVYQKNISSIKKILSGKNRTLTREFKKEMQKLSDARKYEEAARARDKIAALERIFEHRGVIRRDIPSDSAKALRSLESMLIIEGIKRIEAYDIANIQGKFAYGSMSVWENTAIKKDDYRIFKIKCVKGSDDPAMLREVLSRRFRHPEWTFPEVIIIDGGKPQLSAAMRALKLLKAQVLQDLAQSRHGGTSRAIRQPASPELQRGEQANMRVLAKFGAEAIKLIALTKNKKHAGDHVFVGGQKKPIALDQLPPSLKNLILTLDSEAHRFAISYYRKLHLKSLTT